MRAYDDGILEFLEVCAFDDLHSETKTRWWPPGGVCTTP
jgi:hypothetical protein